MASSSNSNCDINISDQSKGLKGKRKKPVSKNANPLFTKWLTEWKEEAAIKGWKSQYIYAKALKTLKLFPLCLETGKDCRMLQHFGDKICKMLDEKLAEYKENHSKEENPDKGLPANTPVLPSTSTFRSESGLKTTNLSSTIIHAISDNSDSGKDESSSPQKRKKRKSSGTRTREYVPQYRSGPYALILTMYRYSEDPNYKGFLTKEELLHAAQPLSDKSFTIPDAGSHYTAWSSMSNLLKKGYVSKHSCPARYILTQEGIHLGERLEDAEIRGNGTTQAETAGGDRNNIRQNLIPPSPPRPVANVNLPEQRLFDVESHSKFVKEKNNSNSNVPFPSNSQMNVDDPVFVVSDEDEVDICFQQKESGLSKISRVHSLSPSSSITSLPSPCASKVFEFPTEKSSEAKCLLKEWSEDISDDDDVNITGVSQATPPKRLCLPSLSPSVSVSSHNILQRSNSLFKTHLEPPPDSVVKAHDNIIEIDDSDGESHATNDLSQRKINIFNNVHHPVSQSSQSDEDDLPDLDFCVPLSERLLNKGIVNSQLLLSHFNKEKEVPESCKIKSLPQKQHYSNHNIQVSGSCGMRSISTAVPQKRPTTINDTPMTMVSKDKVSEPSKPFTSIITKPKDAGTTQNMNMFSDITQPSLPTSTKSVNERDIALETPPVSEFTLHPGTFEIVMCIDNREFYGSKSNSKTLLPDLMQRGVNCDLRLLHIGDILWIAREIVSPNEGPSRADRKELVLNFAIERKRMDDLVSSITGGRLKEQKFRLRHCGLSELIILIEEYGSIQNFSLSEDRIKQSIVNSQILDGFKVKRCGSSKDAVMYLSMMTKFIQKYFGNKILHAASQEYVKDRAPHTTARDKEYYLMPFKSFNEASIKHKALTVKEMFGKQLIQLPGLSLERASAITKVYPSPSLLMKAYGECSTEKAKESLLATIKCGNKERNLGISVSRMVYMIYNTKTLS